MAPSNLPPVFNATSQDIEMLLAAQCHLGSKNLQVRSSVRTTQDYEHMEWLTDGIDIGAYGTLPLENQTGWNKCAQRRQDMVCICVLNSRDESV